MKSDNDPRRFLHPRAVARISRLELRARQVVEGFISGMHRSPFFGRSIEFFQHREYSAGDDIRHLDWKVWSRTDKYYVKQFVEETNLRCNVLLDVSESMRYGNGPLNKFEYAASIAACLCYLMLRQQDAAGLITFDQEVRQIVPARSQHKHLDDLVGAMHVSRPRDKTDIEKVLRRVAEMTPSRGMIVLISDLFVDREPLLRGLELLCHRQHDVLVFHVMDDEELDFEFSGTTRFEGMEAMPDLVCDPRALREGYLKSLDEYLAEVRRGCTRRTIDYSLVRTSDYLDAVLAKFLHARMSFKHSVRARNV